MDPRFLTYRSAFLPSRAPRKIKNLDSKYGKVRTELGVELPKPQIFYLAVHNLEISSSGFTFCINRLNLKKREKIFIVEILFQLYLARS